MEMERPNTGANIQQGMAIYRKPKATLPEFRVGRWTATPDFTDCVADTFCLHPFSPNNSLELLLSTDGGDGWDSCSTIWHQHAIALSDAYPPTSTSETVFKTEVRDIQKAIADGDLQKAVAARSLTVSQSLSADRIWQGFESLHQAYPEAFVFLIIHPQWGCWMGASPETLLHCDRGEAKVMSLAGTLTQSQDGWTEKEALEQSVTSKYIAEVLAAQGVIHAKETQVGEVQMGHIKHLMSEWHFHLPQAQKLINGDLSSAPGLVTGVWSMIQQLHPTPAVGGYPKEAALKWLAEYEDLDRQLYTGFVGLMGQGSAALYVTLRCAQLFQRGYVLYAGCGVNAGSDPEVELQETSAKMQVLGQYLQDSVNAPSRD